MIRLRSSIVVRKLEEILTYRIYHCKLFPSRMRAPTCVEHRDKILSSTCQRNKKKWDGKNHTQLSYTCDRSLMGLLTIVMQCNCKGNVMLLFWICRSRVILYRVVYSSTLLVGTRPLQRLHAKGWQVRTLAQILRGSLWVRGPRTVLLMW